LDETGRETLKVSRTNLVSSANERDWTKSDLFIQPQKTGGFYYSPIFFSEHTGEPIMEMSVPLIDLRTQKPRGVLLTEMKLKFMWHLISTLKIGENGGAFLTDQDGRIIVHPNRSLVLKNTHFEIPRVTRIMQGTNGVKSIVDTRQITFGNLPLYFITEIPASEALRQIYTSLFILGTVLLLTVTGSIVLVIILLRQIVQPLESLASTTKEISGGNYTKRAELYDTLEIGELSTSFNAMTEKLLDTIGSLESQIDFVENIIESLSHPLYVIDIKDHTVKLANSAANFGLLSSDSKCYKLTHEAEAPCSGPDHPCTIDEIKKTRGPVMLEHFHCSAEKGMRRIFEVYGYPIFGANGEINQIIEYNIDVTEKRSLEEQLRQAQKLEAIGSLASGVAHDFNNLLTTILGYGELALMKLPEGDSQREMIESIYEAGKKASTLTRQLLAFSRKQILEMSVINLNNLLENLSRMLTRMIGENVEIRMLLQPGAGNIMADPGQVEQIVMNLAINARDAMPDGGMITVETQQVALDEEYCRVHAEVAPGSYIALYVTDTGQGMTSEVMKKIFDPFFTTKAKGAGTGLGLSTVYGIVKQHNGHIYVYSELGSGTTFKIYFPEVKKAAEEKLTTVFPDMPKGRETLLVADDEVSIRKLVRDTLEPLGYSIIEAADGQEALELSRRTDEKISLLLTDVVMPKMNGKKLAKALLKEKPAVKVLYMSGYTDNVIAHQGVLDEHIEFINKPLVPSLLSKKIREILDK